MFYLKKTKLYNLVKADEAKSIGIDLGTHVSLKCGSLVNPEKISCVKFLCKKGFCELVSC